MMLALFGGIAALALIVMALVIRQPLWGLYLFIFLSAVTEMPSLPVIQDRLSVADFIMALTILVAATKGILFRPAPAAVRLCDQLAGFFILLCTLSSLLALLSGGDPVRVGLFLVIYGYGYLVFRLCLRMITNWEIFARVMLAWGLGATLLTVIGFLAATGIYRPSWTYDPMINRINSTMKLSGQVSSYLGPALFIFFFAATTPRLNGWMRSAAIALLVMAGIVLLSTGNRTSFLMMLVAFMAASAILLTTLGAAQKRAPLLLALALGTGIFAVYAASVWRDTAQNYSITHTSPFERPLKMWSEFSRDRHAGLGELGGTRTEEILTAIRHFPDHPFLGTGSGMFSETYRLNELHNTYFSIVAENGLWAFMCFGLWWGWQMALHLRLTRRSQGEIRLVLRLAFAAMLTLCIYQMSINGMRQRPFWFIPALTLSALALSRQSASKAELLEADSLSPSAQRPGQYGQTGTIHT